MRSAGDAERGGGRAANRHAALWGLAEVRQIAVTRTGRIFRAVRGGEPVILKLLGRDKDEKRSPAILRYFNGRGAVRLLEADGEALLLEALDTGPSLRSLCQTGRDDDATRIIAAVVRELHSTTVTPFPRGVPSLEQRLGSLFAHAEGTASSIHARAASVARRLLAEAGVARLLHGDIHHDNIAHAPRAAGSRSIRRG